MGPPALRFTGAVHEACRPRARMSDDIDARYRFACGLARRAGERALAHWRSRGGLVVELKGSQDWVSEADRDVERLLHEEISTAFPNDRFLGEETAASFSGALDRCWIIDPIDGTHNFLRGVPYWNVAIAYVQQGRAQLAVTYDVPNDALYRAQRGAGGVCEERGEATPLAVAPTTSLDRAFVALGHNDRAPSERYLAIRRRMMERGIAMRNLGSGALQLAYVARGRFDGFIELELAIWDAIGGLLLVEEAGGYVAPFAPATPTSKAAVLACAPGIAPALHAMVDMS
jgi:myo-inositol-1(or 4)-monophosphatase